MSIAGHVSRRMLSRYAHIRTEAKRRALESVATQHSIEASEALLQVAGHKSGHNQQKRGNRRGEKADNQLKEKAPQVGLEPTTLRLTAGSNNYCLVLPGFAPSCFLVLSHRKQTNLLLASICRILLCVASSCVAHLARFWQDFFGRSSLSASLRKASSTGFL